MELVTATQLQSRDYRGTPRPPAGDRHRALARLYERKSAVDNLIGALERYQQEQRQARANRAAPTAVEMSS
jgi:hypothetical protein